MSTHRALHAPLAAAVLAGMLLLFSGAGLEDVRIDTHASPAATAGPPILTPDGQPRGCGAGCSTDIDGDCDVDLADLSAMLTNFGLSGNGLDGDVNGDGFVGLADLSALLSEYGSACPPADCTDGFNALAATFVSHPQNSGLFTPAYTVTDLGTVGDVSAAVSAIVSGAAFVVYPPEAFAVHRLDSTSIPDPGLLQSAIDEYTAYVTSYVSSGDCLVEIEWTPTSGAPFTTLGVADPSGTPKFEPLCDMVQDSEESPDTGPGGPIPQGVGYHEWKNLLGVVKAWASLTVSVLGADGCQGTGQAEFTSGAAFPFIVQPPTASPPVVLTCWPKITCECRANPPQPNKMECFQAAQSYSVIARIGTAWFGADMVTYSGTVRAWACADGQGGSGNF